jgi:hypothetical protein
LPRHRVASLLFVGVQMSRTIGLEPHLMFTGGRTAAHVRGTGSPCGVDDDLVANQPCLAVFDGRRAADEPVPIVAGLQEDHFEAVPSGDVAPRGAEREWTEGGTHCPSRPGSRQDRPPDSGLGTPACGVALAHASSQG